MRYRHNTVQDYVAWAKRAAQAAEWERQRHERLMESLRRPPVEFKFVETPPPPPTLWQRILRTLHLDG